MTAGLTFAALCSISTLLHLTYAVRNADNLSERLNITLSVASNLNVTGCRHIYMTELCKPHHELRPCALSLSSLAQSKLKKHADKRNAVPPKTNWCLRLSVACFCTCFGREG